MSLALRPSQAASSAEMKRGRTCAVHSIHFPVSARSFVAPLVQHLNDQGVPTELWIENQRKYSDAIAGIRVPLRFVDSDLSARPWTVLRRLDAYQRQLVNSGARILHAHQTRASVIPLLAARLARVPIRIYHNHGLPYLGYTGARRALLRALERLNIRLATHVILVSHSNLQAAREDGLLAATVGEVLGAGSAAGIDLTEFDSSHFDEAAASQAREKFGLRQNGFVLGYVGRPVRRKGFHFLLNVWEREGFGRQGFRLVIAGCNDVDCRRVVGHSPEGVLALGYLTDLRPFYAATDAVVLPSEHEGFPYALLEGAAAERALIGADVPGVRCAIRHGQTGILFPRQDAKALGEAVRRIAADPVLRKHFGAQARARVEADFSRATVTNELLRMYQRQFLAAPVS